MGTLTTSSNDLCLKQILNWDTTTRKIQVKHEISLEKLKNANLVTPVKTYNSTDPAYLKICSDYNIDPKNKLVITEYQYNEIADNTRNNPGIVSFPVDPANLPPMTLPQVIVSRVNKTSGTVSSTSGEALSS